MFKPRQSNKTKRRHFYCFQENISNKILIIFHENKLYNKEKITLIFLFLLKWGWKMCQTEKIVKINFFHSMIWKIENKLNCELESRRTQWVSAINMKRIYYRNEAEFVIIGRIFIMFMLIRFILKIISWFF